MVALHRQIAEEQRREGVTVIAPRPLPGLPRSADLARADRAARQDRDGGGVAA